MKIVFCLFSISPLSLFLNIIIFFLFSLPEDRMPEKDDDDDDDNDMDES